MSQAATAITEDKPVGENLVHRIVAILNDLKNESITALDLRGIADFTDYFVISTIFSPSQARATVSRLLETLKAEGIRPVAPIENESPRWTIIDYGDVIVHLFDADARELYQLESVWGDAEQLDLESISAPAAS